MSRPRDMSVNANMRELPFEVVQAIMSALPDVCSLRSMAQSSSFMYQAFSDAENRLTSSVLSNAIGLDILPEAVAALESSQLEPWTRQRIQEFLSQHFRVRRAPPQRYTLSKALQISKLYSHIDYFVADFAHKTLVKSPTAAHRAWPSPHERVRIARTFYRFETYCNLFRNPKRNLFTIEEQREIFFGCFSPWENEQLACVHDYLFRAVSPGMDETFLLHEILTNI